MEPRRVQPPMLESEGLGFTQKDRPIRLGARRSARKRKKQRARIIGGRGRRNVVQARRPQPGGVKPRIILAQDRPAQNQVGALHLKSGF